MKERDGAHGTTQGQYNPSVCSSHFCTRRLNSCIRILQPGSFPLNGTSHIRVQGLERPDVFAPPRKAGSLNWHALAPPSQLDSSDSEVAAPQQHITFGPSMPAPKFRISAELDQWRSHSDRDGHYDPRSWWEIIVPRMFSCEEDRVLGGMVSKEWVTLCGE